ncbi:helix-turn-helix domain-containing protein [Lampropedia puyangensis]|uniref:Helix-turn-helix domain-containing protein n=1 Tax=Lampropedia puyangensis TaxID=1330072 RepID=A0A4S8EXW9_9BURK|nr:helix-turn-helix domain-containing protein [Lampropedia puyangensis]THT97571.1 helix-turn-helix domain-containing protein [Lampropedia puyangensis]
MNSTSRSTRASAVRKFALYGTDDKQPAWAQLVHIESVPERSGLFNWEIDLHFHEGMVQLLYLTHGGEGVARIDGVQWRLRPPCVVVVPARAVHGFSFDPHTDGPVITAAQKPLETLLSAMNPELLELLRKPTVLNWSEPTRQTQALMPLFDSIVRESQWHTQGLNAGMPLLAALFVQIGRMAAWAPDVAHHTRSRKAAQVERFKALLDERCHRREAASDYAQAMGISVGQLSRLTRALLGASAQELINARAVHEAQRELAYSLLSVKQIAAQQGFQDEAYFCRFFKKHTGQRPSEFRTQARLQFAGQ